MQDGHIYKMTSHAPFSVIVGGLARFREKRQPLRFLPHHRVQVTWRLRDVETGQIITATQTADGDHEAIYGTLRTDAPIRENAVYETLSVSAPAAPCVQDQTAAQIPVQHRLGIVRGTRVMTARGDVPVEHLRIGDRVITRDHGLQPIGYVGHQTCKVEGSNAPVLFRADSLKNARDLIVSADTRIVVKGTQALALYGAKEVLVPARQLVDNVNVLHTLGGNITYYQVVTERHQVIYAEAAAIESFMADRAGILALDDANRSALCAAIPCAPECYGPSARGFVETMQ